MKGERKCPRNLEGQEIGCLEGMRRGKKIPIHLSILLINKTNLAKIKV